MSLKSVILSSFWKRVGYKNDKGQTMVTHKHEDYGKFSEGLARISVTKPVTKKFLRRHPDLYDSGYVSRFRPFQERRALNLLYNVSYLVVNNPFNLGFFINKKGFLSGKTVLYV